MAAPQPVQDAKHVNSLMNTQQDISYRFAGEGLDYQKDGIDRSPETLERVDKLLRDGWADGSAVWGVSDTGPVTSSLRGP